MRNRRSMWTNRRIHSFLIIATFALVLIPYLNKTPSLEVSERSSAAAVHFLSLVDSEYYTESWEAASEVLQEMLSREAWNRKIAAMRDAVGEVIERTRQDIVYADPGDEAPAGEYVVVTFITTFKFRDAVRETITLLLDQRGEWQVAGYFLG